MADLLDINIDLRDINIDFNYISSDSEDEYNNENFHQRVRKRYIRDAQNPFEYYHDREFSKRFRFSKNSVRDGLLPMIEGALMTESRRGLPIHPVFKLLITLRYYASASYQVVIGDIMSISQPTVSRIIYQVSTLLASKIRNMIKFPATEEAKLENRRLFNLHGRGRNGLIGLPGIDGAIDCTHIRLSFTKFNNNDNEVYRNRKGYLSLNVQAIIGPRMEFLDIVPQWPGSMHDSRILSNSRVFMRYINGDLDGMLVGDSGYPSLTFLLTPYNNPATPEEEMFNAIQRRTRIRVEMAFGIWKRRFPCLFKGLSTKLFTSTAIIAACAVLHNLSLIFNDNLSDDEEPFVDEEDFPIVQPDWQPQDGFAVRDALVHRLFIH